MLPEYTPVVTILVVIFYLFIGTRVAAARRKFSVPLPATTGHADFERVFRVHQNTLEWMPIFLPSLWLCAVYFSDAVAATLGLVWIVGRAWYYVGYAKQVEKRVPGFFVQAMACLSLLVGAVAGLVTGYIGA